MKYWKRRPHRHDRNAKNWPPNKLRLDHFLNFESLHFVTVLHKNQVHVKKRRNLKLFAQINLAQDSLQYILWPVYVCFCILMYIESWYKCIRLRHIFSWYTLTYTEHYVHLFFMPGPYIFRLRLCTDWCIQTHCTTYFIPWINVNIHLWLLCEKRLA